MHNFYNREYCVAVCRSDEINCEFSNKDFNVIKNGFGYWAADPFPIEVNGTLYIFAELFEYSKVKGAIGYTKKTDEGFTKWKIIIDESYHLSFPNVFQIENTFYMCPEAHESGEVYLYKCIDFPEKWIKDRVIFKNNQAVDTIFVKDGVEVFGITCIWERLNKHTLKLFRVRDGNCEFSDNKSDILPYYLSRPAGKIFYDKTLKKKLAVAQICKPAYGSGLIFKKYNIDWPYYSEEEYKRVLPKDVKYDIKHRYDGIHTFNATEHYIVIDLAWSRINIYEQICRGMKKIKRIKKKGA